MSKVWRTWKRLRQKKGFRRGPIVLALIAVDLFTKWALVTQAWAWHPGEATVWKGLVVALYGLLTASFISPTAGILLVAGSVGNVLSAIQGAVPNPLVLAHVNLAFNVADLYLWTGFALSVMFLARRAVMAR